jgi:hypothetical protein
VEQLQRLEARLRRIGRRERDGDVEGLAANRFELGLQRIAGEERRKQPRGENGQRQV